MYAYVYMSVHAIEILLDLGKMQHFLCAGKKVSILFSTSHGLTFCP